MVKQVIIRFFKPSLPIVILMAPFMSIAIPAQFQRWDPDEARFTGEPKPPFYDELQGYPFRMIYAYLMIPFSFVGVLGWLVGVNLATSMFTLVGVVVNLAYFYISACFIALFWRNIRANGAWPEEWKIRAR